MGAFHGGIIPHINGKARELFIFFGQDEQD
jgi:hypothetical protein